MKTAVVTITIGEFYEKVASFTHSSLEHYARRIGADFIVWREFAPHVHPAYKKLDIRLLLTEDGYERVLFVDTDILIRDDAPNLFSVVPVAAFGAFNEFPFMTERADSMREFAGDGQADKWIASGKYFNTGVFHCSQEHVPLFAQPETEIVNMFEQTHLNYRLFELQTPTFELDPRFNRMNWMDRVTGKSRHDAWFLHYAGYSRESILDEMIKDQKVWERLNRNGYRLPFHPMARLRYLRQRTKEQLRNAKMRLHSP